MLSAQHLELATAPDHRVAMRFHFPGDTIGLADGIGLAGGLRPDEARRIARLLSEQADLAEAEATGRS